MYTYIAIVIVIVIVIAIVIVIWLCFPRLLLHGLLLGRDGGQVDRVRDLEEA